MKNNQEIRNDIENALAAMSPEEREATLAVDDAMDRLMCIKLSRELQARIETIPGDRHHIKVNDEVMGYNEYAEWQANRYAELYPEEAEEDIENEENETPRGFFLA